MNNIGSHVPQIAKEVTDRVAVINKWRGAGLELHALRVKSHVPLGDAQAMAKEAIPFQPPRPEDRSRVTQLAQIQGAVTSTESP